jgi:hypothetical protein
VRRRFAVIGLLLLVAVAPFGEAAATQLLVPMDLSQTNHLKAYGLAYHTLERGRNVRWLLNYRGGSFLMPDLESVRSEARLMDVAFDEVSATQVSLIMEEIDRENMEVVLLEKAPRIAIYAPPTKEPWDDAVLLALTYAEIPHTILYDELVLAGELDQYDWLHLHHEDFTGQHGKFYAAFRSHEWYVRAKELDESLASKLGFAKVPQLKAAVALKIREYVRRGGFLFAMCSATDTIDIALAALGVDICAQPFDGDPPDPAAQEKLDFSQTFAFEGFHLIIDPLVYEFSDIDTSNYAEARGPEADYFTLFDFSAKYDPVPTMLTQNHVNVVNGFLGQTTGYKKSLVKESVLVLGEVEGADEVKYLHGNFGRGTFTFLGGHDPEDYRHAVGDPPTLLDLHVNSPGYRLILNNILFPAARKKEQKT